MRINYDPELPTNPDPSAQWLSDLRFKLDRHLKLIAQQLNKLTEGNISAVTNAYTAAPTTGTWQQGDFIRNSTPTEAGGAGSKYVVFGFICVAAGTPGTWQQCRVLTGN